MRRLAATLALLVSVMALVPAAAAASTVRLVAFGDFGTGGPSQVALGEAIERFVERRPTLMLLTLGDNGYTRGRSFEENWSASFGWVARGSVPISGALGNHDVEATDGSHVFAALGMPGRYYLRSVGRVDIFVLDSKDVGPRQTRWMRRALGRSDARWKIATMHHPAHTCGGHTSEVAVQEHWAPLFERHHVQLVLAGHDHNYQRFAPKNGVHYIVHGGGGGRQVHEFRACADDAPALERAKKTLGFLSVTAGKKRLVVKSVNLRGRQIDKLVIGR